MQLKGVLGSAVVLVAMVASSCQGVVVQPAAGGPSAEPADALAVMGGNLEVGIWEEPPTLLAGITNTLTFPYVTAAPVMEGLLWYRANANTQGAARNQADMWQPWLATEVPTLANGDVKVNTVTSKPCVHVDAAMCVTWHLRSGVFWHDGNQFTADDVCDTFQFWWLRYGAQNPTNLYAENGWNQVTACDESPDKLSATISFSTDYGPYLTLGSGVFGVLPRKLVDPALAAKADIEKLSQTVDLTVGSKNTNAFKGSGTMDVFMDGTGPFVFSKWDKGGQIVLVRNNSYWNRAHLPHLDQIAFKLEPGIAGAIAAMESATTQLSFDLKIYSLKQLTTDQQKGLFTLLTTPESGAEKIDLNTCANSHGLCGPAPARNNSALGNSQFRKALLYGIDRQGIIDTLSATGKTTVPKDSSLYLGAPFLDDGTVPATTSDPIHAQTLLDAAGFKLDKNCDNGQTRSYNGNCVNLDLGTNDNNPARATEESLIAADLQAIGIHVNQPFAPTLPAQRLFASLASGGPLYTHNFDMAIYTSSYFSPGESNAFYGLYHADCGLAANAPSTPAGCPDENQIPSAANSGRGTNDTGEYDSALDQALDSAVSTADLDARAQHYIAAEKMLAKDLPEIPLYQQLLVTAATPIVQGLRLNDLVWDYDSYDWWCAAGKCF